MSQPRVADLGVVEGRALKLSHSLEMRQPRVADPRPPKKDLSDYHAPGWFLTYQAPPSFRIAFTASRCARDLLISRANQPSPQPNTSINSNSVRRL